MSSIIAMWSGPRNISTAMMRAWENRPDCEVWDEPLYAAYLHDSGVVHPMQSEILSSNENNWRRVVARCSVSPSEGKIIFQKHMAHHVLPDYSRHWLASLQHVFLLRHPRDVLRSYALKRKDITLADIGIVEQLDLFRHITSLQGQPPLIIDSADFMVSPESYLRTICAHFSVPFYSGMLSWPAGKRDSDGVWGEHWYANVWQSTGFDAPSGKPRIFDTLPDNILKAAIPAYEKLRTHCLVL